MMKTPISDFIENYKNKKPIRLHMPAHKGKNGFYQNDITEISGADSLFEANGIIKESEKNASSLFECDTFYSTEGSSHCIRAMVYLLKLYGVEKIIALRNAHKSFLSAVALNKIDVEWIFPKSDESFLSCKCDLGELEKAIFNNKGSKIAFYITSPDYLGNIADISAISSICKKNDVLLCVDNAHGAYLKFLKNSIHPIDLGADMCCDSAHKTLPVLTGGAYLHFSKNLDAFFKDNARDSLSIFGSTSPSYLILESLDKANLIIDTSFKQDLEKFEDVVDFAKKHLCEHCYTLIGSEPLKITLMAKKFGYYGFELGEILEKNNIFPEFYDRDFLVLMLSPSDCLGLSTVLDLLMSIEKREEISETIPRVLKPEVVLTIEKTLFKNSEIVDASNSFGRVLSQFNVACPPAVPILVCGEKIDSNAVSAFEYYKIKTVRVIKD